MRNIPMVLVGFMAPYIPYQKLAPSTFTTVYLSSATQIEPKMWFHPAFGHEAATIGTSNLHGTWVPRLIHGHGVSSALLLGVFLFSPRVMWCEAAEIYFTRDLGGKKKVWDLPNLISRNSDFLHPEISTSGTFQKNNTHSSFMEEKFSSSQPRSQRNLHRNCLGGEKVICFKKKDLQKFPKIFPPS